MDTTFPEQLSVAKWGGIKIGATSLHPHDVPPLLSPIVDTVSELQWNYPYHSIWLVGETISVFREDKYQQNFKWFDMDAIRLFCEMNILNLLRLADFLEKLPQEKFDMSGFLRDSYHEALDLPAHECGSVGCAVGWGPAAGLAPIEADEDWPEYSDRVTGLGNNVHAWSWCFGAYWSRTDNTPTGAAARIRHLIYNGLPSDWNLQMHGAVSLTYVDAR